MTEVVNSGDNESGANTPKKSSLFLVFFVMAMALVVVGAIVMFQRRTQFQALAKDTETPGGPDGGGNSPDGRGRRGGLGAAGHAAGVCGVADLRANERISEEVVSRYREPGEQRRVAGGNRHAGSGPATDAGEGGSGTRRRPTNIFRRSRRYAYTRSAKNRWRLQTGSG